jgi:hypothetical protein
MVVQAAQTSLLTGGQRHSLTDFILGSRRPLYQ